MLRAWKERKAAAAGAAGAAAAGLHQKKHENSLQQPQLTKAVPGLPPRLARGAALDKENAGHARLAGQQQGRPGAVGGPAAAAPDSIRKAFAHGQQQQDMLQEFDALQGRLQALKRESMRPSISGAGGPAPPSRHHSALHATAASRPPEAAAARATQPAAPARPAEPDGVQTEKVSAAPLAQPAAAAAPAAAAPLEHAEEDLAAPALPAAPAAHLALPAGGGSTGVGGLAARLESLKRESVRPSLVGAGAQGVQFEAAGQIDAQALTRLAMQLFEDDQFKQLCEKGMNAQLTRSKDGATGECSPRGVHAWAAPAPLCALGLAALDAWPGRS